MGGGGIPRYRLSVQKLLPCLWVVWFCWGKMNMVPHLWLCLVHFKSGTLLMPNHSKHPLFVTSPLSWKPHEGSQQLDMTSLLTLNKVSFHRCLYLANPGYCVQTPQRLTAFPDRPLKKRGRKGGGEKRKLFNADTEIKQTAFAIKLAFTIPLFHPCLQLLGKTPRN